MDVENRHEVSRPNHFFFAILFGILCLIIAYLLLWKRGFYLDDYLFKSVPASFSASRGSGARFLSGFSVSAFLKLLPDYEFLMRLLSIVFIGINGFILGFLTLEITKSRVIAVIAGWLFLMPVWATEAVLWATGLIIYVPNASFILLYVYLSYRAFAVNDNAWRWISGALFSFFIALNFREMAISTLVVLPFLMLIVRWQYNQSRLRLLFKFSVLSIIPVILTLIYYILFYRRETSLIAREGSLILNPAQLWEHVYNNFLLRLYYRFISPQIGMRTLGDGFRIGIETIFSSFQSIALLLLAIILLIFVVLCWKRDDKRTPVKIMFTLLCMSVVWMFTSLLIPIALIDTQTLSPRIIYLPTAGICLGLATFMTLITPRNMQKLIIFFAGCFTIFLTIISLGFAYSYAVRAVMDDYLIADFDSIVSFDRLELGTRIIMTNIAHEIPPATNFFIPNNQDAIFEHNAGVENMIAAYYDRTDLDFILANRWMGNRPDFSCTTPELLASGQLCVMGVHERPVTDRIDNFLVITSRNEMLFLVAEIHFQFSDETHIVELPRIESHTANGSRVLSHIVIELENG